MTGFASLTRENERASIGVTVRAVNHRYLDVQTRLPQTLAVLETTVRALVQRRIARGRLELAVVVQARQPPAPEVEVNEALVRSLAEAFERIRANQLVEGRLRPGDLLRLPQAVVIREAPPEVGAAFATAVAPLVERAVAEALDDLDSMRMREGFHLKSDLDERLGTLASLIDRIAEDAEQGRAGLEARLAARVNELAAELPVDRTLIAQEVVRMAARSDITEETVRFRAHLSQWAGLVDGQEPCGRKLDFLLQEMNREVNTIAAKADGLAVSGLVVNAKAELEKMREQVQNVE